MVDPIRDKLFARLFFAWNLARRYGLPIARQGGHLESMGRISTSFASKFKNIDNNFGDHSGLRRFQAAEDNIDIVASQLTSAPKRFAFFSLNDTSKL